MHEPYDEYIEQEVVPKMKTVCAWCGKTMREADPEDKTGDVSHGICSDCRNRSAEPLEDALGQDLLQAYLEAAYANYPKNAACRAVAANSANSKMLMDEIFKILPK